MPILTHSINHKYKANHDLLQQAPTGAGTSSRTTRRAHTERLQLFKDSVTENPATKGKHNGGTIWSILSDMKGKSIEKPHDASDLSRGRTKSTGKGKAKETMFNRTPSRAHASRVTSLGPFPDGWDDSISQADRPPLASHSGSGRLSRKRPSTSGDMESISMNGHSFSGSARKKRRLGDNEISSMPPPSSVPNGRSSKRLQDGSNRLSVSADPRSQTVMNGSTRAFRHDQSSISLYSNEPSPVKSGITRIKLIVRKPPPLISNPRQRPPAPRFGSSLEKFLSSYITYNDQDFTEEALEGLARNESITLDRIDDFRRQGRLLPEFDSGSAVMSTATGTTHKRGPDIWDHIVEEVVARAKRNGNGGRGKQIAAQVASRIQGYWDGYAQREDKAKAQEERRLRSLAKATIKMVTGEWKKAVFVRCALLPIGEEGVLIIVFAAYPRTGTHAHGSRGKTPWSISPGCYPRPVRTDTGDATR